MYLLSMPVKGTLYMSEYFASTKRSNQIRWPLIHLIGPILYGPLLKVSRHVIHTDDKIEALQGNCLINKHLTA